MSEENIIKTALSKATLQEALVCVMEWEIHRAVNQALNNSDPSKTRIATHHDGALYDTCSTFLVSRVLGEWGRKTTKVDKINESIGAIRDFIQISDCSISSFYFSITDGHWKQQNVYPLKVGDESTSRKIADYGNLVTSYLVSNIGTKDNVEINVIKSDRTAGWYSSGFKVHGENYERVPFKVSSATELESDTLFNHAIKLIEEANFQSFLSSKHMEGVDHEKIRTNASEYVSLLESAIRVLTVYTTNPIQKAKVAAIDINHILEKRIMDFKLSFGIPIHLQ